MRMAPVFLVLMSVLTLALTGRFDAATYMVALAIVVNTTED
jgi:hypothetical protein